MLDTLLRCCLSEAISLKSENQIKKAPKKPELQEWVPTSETTIQESTSDVAELFRKAREKENESS